MKAHVISEPDTAVLITGCDTPDDTRTLAVAELYEFGYDSEEADAWLKSAKPSIETGRIVPAGPNGDWLGCTWYWHSGYEKGKPGVTTAVVWRQATQ